VNRRLMWRRSKPASIGRASFVARFVPPKPLRATGRRFIERVASVELLVMKAYDLRAYQLVGLPEWAKPQFLTKDGEYFSIEAITQDENPTTQQLQAMQQSLLAERFQLRVHWETRELSVYALVLAKRGPRFRKVGDDVASKFISVYDLITFYSPYAERAIVDHTGLTGSYDFPLLNFTGLRRDDPDAGLVSSILKDQLGLKLEARKETTDVLVVDHVVRPSPN
jgi:hypothetical protein